MASFMKCILVLIFAPTLCLAQATNECNCKTPPKHRWLINATGLKSLNKNKWPDIEQVSLGKSAVATYPNFLTVNNTFGYQVGVGYEYTNRRRYTFTPSVLFGQYTQDYSWNFTFYNFDSTRNLGDEPYPYTYHNKTNYLAVSMALGRNYDLTESGRLTLQLKAGLNYMHPFKREYQGREFYVIYDDLHNELTYKQFAWTSVDPVNEAFYYNVDVGISYITKHQYIKELRLGLTFLHAWHLLRDNDEINTAGSMYFNVNQQIIGGETFHNRFRNIGLTLGIAF